MEAIKHDIQSPDWWFSIVIVGIMVGLASAYIKSPIDIAVSPFWKWWAARSEKSRIQRARRVQSLRDNPSEQLFHLVLTLYWDFGALFLLAFGSLNFLFSERLVAHFNGKGMAGILISLFQISLMFFVIIIAISINLKANSRRSEIFESRRQKPTDENSRHE